MAGERPNDAVDHAMRVMRDLRPDREATVVIAGRGVDRLMARLIDAGVLAIIAYVLFGLASMAELAGNGEMRSFRLTNENGTLIYWGPTALSRAVVVAWAAFVAVFVLYELLSHRFLGATPGKRRTQLIIVDSASLAPASAPRLLLRTLIWALPLAFGVLTIFHSLFYCWGAFGLVFAMYLCNRRQGSQGRPLWDAVAGTRVVSTILRFPDRP